MFKYCFDIFHFSYTFYLVIVCIFNVVYNQSIFNYVNGDIMKQHNLCPISSTF